MISGRNIKDQWVYSGVQMFEETLVSKLIRGNNDKLKHEKVKFSWLDSGCSKSIY